MKTVSLRDAKARLSELIDAVESGAQDEIIITRHGRPTVRLVAASTKARRPVRLGLAKGLFEAPPFPDGMDEEVAALFLDSKDSF